MYMCIIYIHEHPSTDARVCDFAHVGFLVGMMLRRLYSPSPGAQS